MKKKVLLALILCVSIGLSALGVSAFEKYESLIPPAEVTELISNNKNRIIETIKNDLEITLNTELSLNDFKINDKAYRVNYVNEIDLNKNYSDISQIMHDENHWLYIIEFQKNSYSYLLVGQHEGIYDILMYGGNADMFYTAKSFMNSSPNEVLSYSGNYYFLDKQYDLIQVPATKSDYLQMPEAYKSEISQEKSLELILENYSEFVNTKMSEMPIKGYSSLVEQIYNGK